MPIYTYRCPEGHTWEEFRVGSAGSETSEERCGECPRLQDAPGRTAEQGILLMETLQPFGIKVPSQFAVAFRGRGWTPTFYRNRKDNK